MGCKAVTPHLVSLAKRLEGRPFHLIASHNQRNPKEEVLAYMQSRGLSTNTPNFTVTSFGRHPKVKGNGFVPYYMVFDQHGDLVQHHMCGDYHGGDGLEMIEWVDKLLEETRDIYIGREPFEHAPKLAEQIADKKNLSSAIKKMEKEIATGPIDDRMADLERLHAVLLEYRDGRLKNVDALLFTQPGLVLSTLKELDKEFKGTALGEPVSEKLAVMSKSTDLKTAIGIAKTFEKEKSRVEKEASASNLKKARGKLEKAIEGHEELPISKTVKEYLEGLSI